MVWWKKGSYFRLGMGTKFGPKRLAENPLIYDIVYFRLAAKEASENYIIYEEER